MSIELQQTIDHRSIKRKSWRSRSRGAERISRAGASATGEDESRDTKTFLKKGYREGSKRIISMHCEKASSNMHLPQTPHYAQNLIAQKLLVFWGRILLPSSHKVIKMSCKQQIPPVEKICSNGVKKEWSVASEETDAMRWVSCRYFTLIMIPMNSL